MSTGDQSQIQSRAQSAHQKAANDGEFFGRDQSKYIFAMAARRALDFLAPVVLDELAWAMFKALAAAELKASKDAANLLGPSVILGCDFAGGTETNDSMDLRPAGFGRSVE